MPLHLNVNFFMILAEMLTVISLVSVNYQVFSMYLLIIFHLHGYPFAQLDKCNELPTGWFRFFSKNFQWSLNISEIFTVAYNIIA